ncbi:OsmC family protein [Aquirufa antheringensis]|jgi:putative redox protein|uniref:OsmC family protein n=1 Tax=Aquirufa antheringensis TaxID=2516559 RepID=UPI00208E8D4D|nr:OsmC family protein [Aquirufa antheringensis]MCZ2488118.1 OsmC family protein [Aquirufa antheringensis]MCZ2489137.1 OsmC family protein [Aquirufa antheringensis]USQ02638.1 OsmC family protein [Aquirufa antheringensis]
MEVVLNRLDQDFHFEAKGSSPIPVHIDAAEGIGGHNAGARPMELLLMGLGGCTAIDVILILKKQRQVVEDFQIRVSGDREKIEGTEKTPFRQINIQFELKGQIDGSKALKAIQMSMDKYCSATAQLEPSSKITHTLVLNGEKFEA